MGRHIVGTTNEIPVGGRKVVSIKGRELVIFNLDGEYFALLNRCPHEGASLACGLLVGLVQSSEPGQFTYSRRGEMLRCPWHGWEYDIRTGQSYCDPEDVKVKSYPAKIEPGDELVKGPYVADTFPVSVDENYVVVEI